MVGPRTTKHYIVSLVTGLWKATNNDHVLDGRVLHVEAFYPYMGTIVPVDEPNWPSRPLFSEADHQPDAIQRQLRDPVLLGFTQPDIRYEWNKLYVLGLDYRTSPDSLKNFMELISGYEVKRVDWFKPNGKAIVTFNIQKVTGDGKNRVFYTNRDVPQVTWLKMQRIKYACTRSQQCNTSTRFAVH